LRVEAEIKVVAEDGIEPSLPKEQHFECSERLFSSFWN